MIFLLIEPLLSQVPLDLKWTMMPRAWGCNSARGAAHTRPFPGGEAASGQASTSRDSDPSQARHPSPFHLKASKNITTRTNTALRFLFLWLSLNSLPRWKTIRIRSEFLITTGGTLNLDPAHVSLGFCCHLEQSWGCAKLLVDATPILLF